MSGGPHPAGTRPVGAWLSPEDYATLDTYRMRQGFRTMTEAIRHIVARLRSEMTQDGGNAAQPPKGLTPALPADSRGVKATEKPVEPPDEGAITTAREAGSGEFRSEQVDERPHTRCDAAAAPPTAGSDKVG